MADGRIRRHGRREHSYEQRDGGWWDRENPVSKNDLFRYFGKDQLLQNERGGWDFNRAREDSLTNKQKRERINYEMDYDKFPYDRRGNRFVRDPNVPLTQFEQIENNLEGMMGGMKSGMGGKENLFNEMDSMGKGFWEPIQNNPYLPKDRGSEWRNLQADIERSGEINRGLGFGRENYGFGDYKGKSWSSPLSGMSSPFNNRTKSNYLESYKPGKLNQLSPSGIDNYNSGGWNSGMKNWR